MEDLVSFVGVLQEWWTFVFAAFVFNAVGRVAKRLAPRPYTSRLWKFYWQTMPLHPVIAGVFVGLATWAPVPPVVAAVGGKGASALYYAGAGYLSVHFHAIVHTWKKYKAV